MNKRQVPYIVAGTGGISVQAVAAAQGQVVDAADHVTYDAALKSLGYLMVRVSAHQLKIEFRELGSASKKPFDPITVDLASGILTPVADCPQPALEKYRAGGVS